MLAVVTDRYPVLSETFVSNEIAELRKLGFRVLIEAERQAPGAPPAVGPVHYLSDERRMAKPRAFAELAARHPVRVSRDWASRRRWRADEPVRRVRALALRARRFRQADVAHIHTHFAAGAALDSMRLARILSIPYSVTAHAYDIFETPTNLREKLNGAAFVTTGCEYNRRHLVSVLGPGADERVHVIVMGVDPERFKRSTLYPGGRHVVAVGRLIEKKGFCDLIAAAGLLESTRPLDRVTIVGTGPLRDDLAVQIHELGLVHRVHLAGSQSPDAVRDLLGQADLLAMPAVVARNGDRDSMPVVVKEAMAMELPIVATDEVGLPELVKPSFGRLVPPSDATALAAAILEVLDRPVEERIEMGAAARAHVLEHGSLARETRRLADLIDAVAPGAR